MASYSWWGSYGGYVIEAAKTYNLDPNLIAAVIQVESGGNPKAHGPSTKWGRAVGMMQLLPSTARGLGVNNPWDARQNIMGGAKYLKQNLDRFGSTRDAILAYHGGPSRNNWGPKTRNYLELVTGNINSKNIGPGGGGYELTPDDIRRNIQDENNESALDLAGKTVALNEASTLRIQKKIMQLQKQAEIEDYLINNREELQALTKRYTGRMWTDAEIKKLAAGDKTYRATLFQMSKAEQLRPAWRSLFNANPTFADVSRVEKIYGNPENFLTYETARREVLPQVGNIQETIRGYGGGGVPTANQLVEYEAGFSLSKDKKFGNKMINFQARLEKARTNREYWQKGELANPSLTKDPLGFLTL